MIIVEFFGSNYPGTVRVMKLPSQICRIFHIKKVNVVWNPDGVYLPAMWNMLYVHGRLYRDRTPDKPL
jgi:hypothetical protein